MSLKALALLLLLTECSSQSCPKSELPAVPKNAKFLLGSIDPMHESYRVRVLCDPGHKLTDKQNTNVTCRAGKWVGDLSDCEAIKCNKTLLDKAIREGSTYDFEPNTETEMTDHNTKAVMRCTEGYCQARFNAVKNSYSLTDTIDYILCHYGLWFGLRPNICINEGIYCKTDGLQIPQFGKINFPTKEKDGLVDNGGLAELSCDPSTHYLTEPGEVKDHYTATTNNYAVCKCESWKANEKKCTKLPDTILLYQVFNSHTTDYTYIPKDRYDNIDSKGVKKQGPKCQVIKTEAKGNCPEKIPLYRLYKKWNSNEAEHIYTTSEKEKNTRESENQPWKHDETLYCVRSFGECGATVPFERYVKIEDEPKQYFYTPGQVPVGYRYKKTECYVWPV